MDHVHVVVAKNGKDIAHVEDANREDLALAFVTMVKLVPALITPNVDNMRQNVNLND